MWSSTNRSDMPAQYYTDLTRYKLIYTVPSGNVNVLNNILHDYVL